jgi:hypothetical protein
VNDLKQLVKVGRGEPAVVAYSRLWQRTTSSLAPGGKRLARWLRSATDQPSCLHTCSHWACRSGLLRKSDALLGPLLLICVQICLGLEGLSNPERCKPAVGHTRTWPCHRPGIVNRLLIRTGQLT